MMQHTFTVYLKVRGQGRPRVDFMRKKTYKPKADRDYEGEIKKAYINSNGPWFGRRPIELTVETFRTLPKSTPLKVEREHDTKKPDGSNELKAIEDALNGIAYVDDSQVVHSEVWKHPRSRADEKIIVTIREIGYEDYPTRR